MLPRVHLHNSLCKTLHKRYFETKNVELKPQTALVSQVMQLTFILTPTSLVNFELTKHRNFLVNKTKISH